MTLSEAIRLGAMMKPQGYHGFFDGVGTCAIGAAADAVGQLAAINGDVTSSFYEMDHWPILKRVVEHPILHSHERAWDVITDLNDGHDWSREQIADWVATIEPASESASKSLAVLVEIGTQ